MRGQLFFLGLVVLLSGRACPTGGRLGETLDGPRSTCGLPVRQELLVRPARLVCAIPRT